MCVCVCVYHYTILISNSETEIAKTDAGKKKEKNNTAKDMNGTVDSNVLCIYLSILFIHYIYVAQRDRGAHLSLSLSLAQQNTITYKKNDLFMHL